MNPRELETGSRQQAGGRHGRALLRGHEHCGRATSRAAAQRRVAAPPLACPGVALLEVVLALALFFGVAVAILGGLNTCVRLVRQVRMEAAAADLAVTLLSEIEIGVVPPTDSGPNLYEEPLQDWTWEIVATPVEGPLAAMDVQRVEVILRNTTEGYVYRLYQLLPSGKEEADTGQASAAAAETGGGT